MVAIPILQMKCTNTPPRTMHLGCGSQAFCPQVCASRASRLPCCASCRVCSPWLCTWVCKNMVNFTKSHLTELSLQPPQTHRQQTRGAVHHCGCVVTWCTASLGQEITAIPGRSNVQPMGRIITWFISSVLNTAPSSPNTLANSYPTTSLHIPTIQVLGLKVMPSGNIFPGALPSQVPSSSPSEQL